MRAIWKGTIRLGKLAVPVKLYSAVEDRSVHLRILHEKDLVPVKQKMIHPETGEEVPFDEIRRGYEIERGTFVILDENDLVAAEPEPSRDIEILRFVRDEAVDHRWYERPYFLGPDGSGPQYDALRRAMEGKGLEGLSRWVMRKKSYAGALRLMGDALVLVTMRHAGEVVSTRELPKPGERKLDSREQKMAAQLIESLADDLDLSEFRDEYREKLMELIETKAKGGKVKLKKFRPRAASEDEDLASSLEASLAELKKKRA
jgi:DNA end-binding protein Ku